MNSLAIAMTVSRVDWNQLAQIDELNKYFQEDFEGFKNLVEQYVNRFEQFGEQELNKLAYLRVLEVTNGCTQYGYRRQDKESLSVEDTRQCMKMVMEFIKNTKVYFPSKGTIVFSPEVKYFIKTGREMYRSAFKNNVPGMKREYYASSAAQFIAYGRQNIESAMDCVKQDYENLFSTYYVEKGRDYIAPYLASMS